MIEVRLPYKAPIPDDEMKNLYKQVFDNSDGRIVLEDIVARLCDVGVDVFSTDTQQMTFRLGKQKVGLNLLKLLNT